MNLTRLPYTLGIAWAIALIAAAVLIPNHASWTIDDSIKRIAAQNGTGIWAETIPDGALRSKLGDPAAFAPLHPPFAARVPGGFAVGFSPWTRAFFKLVNAGGQLAWKIVPALLAIAMCIILVRAGFVWAFLLLPLTFYGLVPWEHVLSWLLLWPAVVTALKQKAKSKNQKSESRGSDFVCGLLLGLAVLLRPETVVLVVALVGYLLFMRMRRNAAMLSLGCIVSIGVMLLLHEATSSQPALAQIGLNLIGPGGKGIGGWIARWPAAFYGLLLRMDLAGWESVMQIGRFAIGVGVLIYAEKKKSKWLLTLALAWLTIWVMLYQHRMWTSVLPPLALMYANSLLACLPWTALLVLPPYRKRPAFLLAMISVIITILVAPVWQGVHWGPRILLFVVPLLMVDLYHSGRARGWVFYSLLFVTAMQTVSSAALVYARYSETADRIRYGAPHLGNPIICPTMSQCADLAPLWKEDEFFTASTPAELSELLIDFRFMGLDTVWLHMDAMDSLYVKTFPESKPVWAHHMTVLKAGSLYKTPWRIMELVMNRSDSAWAGPLEAEAGKFLAQHQPDAALRLQREAVAVAPRSAQAHSNLALLLASVGEHDEALNEANTAVELDPNLTAARRILEMLHSQPSDAP